MNNLRDTTRDLRLLGDPSRVRLLALLAKQELTVAELTRATRLSQPRVSSHLARLKEGGWVKDRRAGSASFYALHPSSTETPAWRVLEGAFKDPALLEDLARAQQLVKQRAAGASWPDSIAGRMERRYSPGRTWEAALRGLLGLLRLGKVLDIGAGDGALAQLIAPRADAIVCLDQSRKMLAAARRRLAGFPRVSLRHGDMHRLPFADGSFDAALLMNSLDYSTAPATVIREAARVLAPGGVLAGSTLKRHRHPAASRPFGHVQQGFEPAALARLLREAGLSVSLCQVTSLERRPPRFEVISFHASKGRA